MRKYPNPAWAVLIPLLCGWSEPGAIHNPYRAEASGRHRLVAVGKSRCGAGFARVSTDGGCTWSRSLTIARFDAVSFGNGLFVACGEYGAAGVSADGETWKIRSLGERDLTGIAFRAGNFYVTDGGTVWTSKDGIAWHLQSAQLVLNDFSAPGKPGRPLNLETWVTVAKNAAHPLTAVQPVRAAQTGMLPRDSHWQ